MSDCRDKRFKSMLHAYEFGILDDQDRCEIEIHLLECEDCLNDVKQFSDAARLLQRDPDVRDTVYDIYNDQSQNESDRYTKSFFSRLWSGFAPISILIVVMAMLMVLKDWQIEIRPAQDAMASQTRLAVMYFSDSPDREDSSKTAEITASLIITDLSESHFLQVVPSQRIFDVLQSLDKTAYQTTELETALQVADRTDANLILMGSIYYDHLTPVLTSQIIDASSGNVIAAQKSIGQTNESIFTVVDKLTSQIKSDLSLPASARVEPDRMIAEVTTSSPDAYRYYLEGLEYYYKFYYSEARESFEQALEHDSSMAMAYYYLASLKDRSYINKALELSDRASRKEQMYIKSRAAFIDDNRIQAVEELKTLVRNYPDEKTAYYLLGVYHYRLFKNREAVEYLNKALEIDPVYRGVYNQLAYVYDELGDLENALKAVNKYVELAPDEANPYDSRAMIYSNNGMLDKAIESYRQALEIKPDFMSAVSYLGNMYLFKNDYQRADSCYRVYVNHENKYYQSAGRLYLTYIPTYRGKLTRAMELYNSNISLESEEGMISAMNYVLKSRMFADQKNYDSAVAVIDDYLNAVIDGDANDNAVNHHYYIQILAESGKLDRAKEMLHELRESMKKNNVVYPCYHYAQASIDYARGDYEKAIINFKKTDDQYPEFYVKYMLAQSYYHAGHLSDAVKTYESTISKYSSLRAFFGTWSVRTHYYLGICYEDSRWYDKAIEQYETFLDIYKNADPDIVQIDDARLRLARLKSKS